MPELPSGTVTFVFTDIERFTKLWEDHPDAMQKALVRHDVLLRAAIQQHNGHIVKITGDGPDPTDRRGVERDWKIRSFFEGVMPLGEANGLFAQNDLTCLMADERWLAELRLVYGHVKKLAFALEALRSEIPTYP